MNGYKSWASVIGLGLALVGVGCITRPASPAKPQLTILLDDAGEYGAYDVIFSLPQPVSLAVLPGTPLADWVLREARRHGTDVIGHIPMESFMPDDSGNVSLVTDDMDEKEVRAHLETALRALPGIRGINNHRGSAASVNPKLMDWVMAVLKEKGLFMVDSRTHHDSIIPEVARRHGVPCLAKNEFIDSEAGEVAARRHLDYLLTRAKQSGYALGIGHVYHRPALLALNRFMNEHAGEVEFVGINRLIKKFGRPTQGGSRTAPVTSPQTP